MIPIEILKQTTSKHRCPKCGGEDQCQFINPKIGTVLCSNCFKEEYLTNLSRDNDFIAAVGHFRGVSQPEAFQLIANYLGFRSKPTSAKDAPSRSIGEWNYKHENGSPLYDVNRFEQIENGIKYQWFTLRHLTESKYLDWEPGLSAKLKKTGGVPFGLPELLKRTDEPVFIVADEMCCDAITSLGLLATTACWKIGEEKLDWPKYIQHQNVVILADQEYGKYALRAAQTLRNAERLVKVVNLPGLNETEDVVDWIERGGTHDELLRIVDATPVWKGDVGIGSVSAASVQPDAVNATDAASKAPKTKPKAPSKKSVPKPERPKKSEASPSIEEGSTDENSLFDPGEV